MKTGLLALGLFAALLATTLPTPLASAYYGGQPLIIQNNTHDTCVQKLDQTTGVSVFCGHAQLTGQIVNCDYSDPASQTGWMCTYTVTVSMTLDPGTQGGASVGGAQTHGCSVDFSAIAAGGCSPPTPGTGAPQPSGNLDATGQEMIGGEVDMALLSGALATSDFSWHPILVFPPPVTGCSASGSGASASLAATGASVTVAAPVLGVSRTVSVGPQGDYSVGPGATQAEVAFYTPPTAC